MQLGAVYAGRSRFVLHTFALRFMAASVYPQLTPTASRPGFTSVHVYSGPCLIFCSRGGLGRHTTGSPTHRGCHASSSTPMRCQRSPSKQAGCSCWCQASALLSTSKIGSTR